MARLSKDQVCEKLGIHRGTIERWMFLKCPYVTRKSGKISFKTHRFGKRTFYDFDAKEVSQIEEAMKKSKKEKSRKL